MSQINSQLSNLAMTEYSIRLQPTATGDVCYWFISHLDICFSHLYGLAEKKPLLCVFMDSSVAREVTKYYVTWRGLSEATISLLFSN